MLTERLKAAEEQIRIYKAGKESVTLHFRASNQSARTPTCIARCLRQIHGTASLRATMDHETWRHWQACFATALDALDPRVSEILIGPLQVVRDVHADAAWRGMYQHTMHLVLAYLLPPQQAALGLMRDIVHLRGEKVTPDDAVKKKWSSEVHAAYERAGTTEVRGHA